MLHTSHTTPHAAGSMAAISTPVVRAIVKDGELPAMQCCTRFYLQG